MVLNSELVKQSKKNTRTALSFLMGMTGGWLWDSGFVVRGGRGGRGAASVDNTPAYLHASELTKSCHRF